MRNIELKFNKTDLISTEYDPKTSGDGEWTSYALWYSTDYIDVSGDYAFLFTLAGHKYLYSIAFFDADRNFIRGETLPSTSRCATLHALTVRPEGAVWARCVNFKNGGESFLDASLQALESREDYENYQIEFKRSDLVIACLGDSLTEGDQGTNTHGLSSMTYRNYPYYLSKILSCTTLNFGKCGYAVSDYVSCYSSGDVNVKNADVILIMLGTNAGMSERGQQVSFNNLLRRIAFHQKEGAVVVLMTPLHATETPGKASYGHGYPENVRSSSEYVRAYAEEHGCLLIDANAESPIREENEALYQPNDGLHLNSAGYEVFARFVADKLIELGVI